MEAISAIKLWYIDYTEGAVGIVKRMEKVEQSVNKLWQLWRTEYLQFSTDRTALQRDLRKYRGPHIDEVVLLRDDKVAKYKWKLARVTKLIRRKESRVTSTEVRISSDKISGKRKRDEIRYAVRSVEYLFCLEVPNRLEGDGQERHRANPNLEKEEPEIAAMNIETDGYSAELTDIPKVQNVEAVWWTDL